MTDVKLKNVIDYAKTFIKKASDLKGFRMKIIEEL